ncbi:MAG: zf-TFIIB domain-containing protein [Labilithrix sp.]|nr:zf-TFIIB domain-containing protein [Labilithrix sp.]
MRCAASASSLPAFGCSACGGLWLAPEAAVHVMRGLGDALESSLARAGNTHERVSVVPPPPDLGERGCPRCGVTMMRVTVGSIVIDSCVAHGTWFDRGELDGVVSACRKLKALQAPEDPSVIEGVAGAITFLVTGTATVAWNLLVAIVEIGSRASSDNGSDGR